ncbi:ABC transporter ATP-binding protein [Nonomuraea sp. K274]|uniref:ABC transporter ATP-binding protein n=2 Tax=Nonomuraea cypriaca TaxID=1187855 RepID=A0A931A6J4_9ACTN|nr:ABC transporter ATP-binding protein [Nonomuraea cypriaca]
MSFGGLSALNDVTLTVPEHHIVGLIGPNGAGKTTLFNCLTGLYAPTSGRVLLNGRPLAADPAEAARRGIARTFQNIRLFSEMSVIDNVLTGRHTRIRQSLLSALLHGPGYRRSEAEAVEWARAELAFVGLDPEGRAPARSLAYGDQRRLEIARALAGDPAVLMLDEPTAGMNAKETAAVRELIIAIRERGIAVVVIEHDTKFIFSLCDHVHVLVRGQMLVEGPPAVVRADQRVIEAYLGAA